MKESSDRHRRLPLRLLEGLPFLSLQCVFSVFFLMPPFSQQNMDTATTPGLGSPQTSFTSIAAAPVEEGKVGQEGGLFKRARTPPQNITADG